MPLLAMHAAAAGANPAAPSHLLTEMQVGTAMPFSMSLPLNSLATPLREPRSDPVNGRNPQQQEAAAQPQAATGHSHSFSRLSPFSATSTSLAPGLHASMTAARAAAGGQGGSSGLAERANS
jgi:hypothetical protein